MISGKAILVSIVGMSHRCWREGGRKGRRCRIRRNLLGGLRKIRISGVLFYSGGRVGGRNRSVTRSNRDIRRSVPQVWESRREEPSPSFTTLG